AGMLVVLVCRNSRAFPRVLVKRHPGRRRREVRMTRQVSLPPWKLRRKFAERKSFEEKEVPHPAAGLQPSGRVFGGDIALGPFGRPGAAEACPGCGEPPYITTPFA